MFYRSRSPASFTDEKYGKAYNFSSDLSPRNPSLQRVLNSEYGRRDRSCSPSRDYSSSSRLFHSALSADASTPLRRRDASPGQSMSDRSSPISFLNDYSVKSRNYYDFPSTSLFTTYSSIPIKKPKRTDYTDYLRPVVTTRPILKTGYVPRSRAEREESNPISRDRKLIKFREMSDEVLEKIRRKISWDLPEEISSPLIDEMKKRNAEFCDEKSECEPKSSSRRGSRDVEPKSSSRRGSRDVEPKSSSRRGSRDVEPKSSSRRGSRDVEPKSTSRRGSRDVSRRSSQDQSSEKLPLRKSSRTNSLIASTDEIHGLLDSKSEDGTHYSKAPIPPPRKKSLASAHKLKARKSSIEILLSEEKTQNYSKIAADIRRSREIVVESLKKLADETANETEEANDALDTVEESSDRSRHRRRRISVPKPDEVQGKPPEIRRRRSRFASQDSNESISPSSDLKHTSDDRYANEAPCPVSRMHRKSVKYKPDGLPPRRSSKGSHLLPDSLQKEQHKESNIKHHPKKIVSNEELIAKSKVEKDPAKSELNKMHTKFTMEDQENARPQQKRTKIEDARKGKTETSDKSFVFEKIKQDFKNSSADKALKGHKERANVEVCVDKAFKPDAEILKMKMKDKIPITSVKETETECLNKKSKGENKLIREEASSNKVAKVEDKALNDNDYKREKLRPDIQTTEKEKQIPGRASNIEIPQKSLVEQVIREEIPKLKESPSKEIEEIVVVCKLPQPKKDLENIPNEQKVVVSLKTSVIKPVIQTENIEHPSIPTARSNHSKLHEISNQVADVNVTHTVVLKPKPQTGVQISKNEKTAKHLRTIPDIIKNTVNCATKGSEDVSDVVKSTLSKSDDQSKIKLPILPDIKGQALMDKCDVSQITTQKIQKVVEISNSNNLAPTTNQSLLSLQKSSSDMKERTTSKISTNIKKSNSDVFDNTRKFEERSCIKPDLIQMTTKLDEKVNKPLANISINVSNKQFKDEKNFKIQNESKSDKDGNDASKTILLKSKTLEKDVPGSTLKGTKLYSSSLETIKGSLKDNEPRDSIEEIKTSIIDKTEKSNLKDSSFSSSTAIDSHSAASKNLQLDLKRADDVGNKVEIKENMDAKQAFTAEAQKQNNKALPQLELKKGVKEFETLKNKVPNEKLTFLDEIKKTMHTTQAYKKSMTVPDMSILIDSSQEKIVPTNIHKDTSLTADAVPPKEKPQKLLKQALEENEHLQSVNRNKLEAVQLPPIHSTQKELQTTQEAKLSNNKLCAVKPISASENKDEEKPSDKIAENLVNKLKSEVKIKDAQNISTTTETLPPTQDHAKLLSTTRLGKEEISAQEGKDSITMNVIENTVSKISNVATTEYKDNVESKTEKLPPVSDVTKYTNNLNQQKTQSDYLDKSIQNRPLDEKCQTTTEVIEFKTQQNVLKPISNTETRSHAVKNLVDSPIIQKEIEIEPKMETPAVQKQVMNEIKVSKGIQQPKPIKGKVPKIPEYKRYGLFIRPKEPPRSLIESSSSEDSSEESESETESSEETAPVGNKNLKIANECNVTCHQKCEKFMPNLCGVNQKLLSEVLHKVKKGKCPDQNEKVRTRSETSINSNVSNSTTFTTLTSDDEYGSPKRTQAKGLRFRKYDIDDFAFLKLLGKGSFGKVLLAELKGTEMYFAIKCLKKDVVLEDDDVESTMIERRVLALGTQHPYMCKLYCTFQSESYLYFVMEYLNGGDLMFHIQENGRFEEKRAIFYGAEIVSALKFLHKRGIVYRDIKLDNIILDEDGHVHLVDFGMCKTDIFEDKRTSTFCGTPDYIPPEIVMGKTYNESVDWWSFGVLLYEMLIGRSPFQGTDEDELFWSICNEEPPYPRFLSKEATHILGLLLAKSPNKRLGMLSCPAGDIKDHAFFSAICWEKVETKQLPPVFRPRVSSPSDTSNFDSSFTMDSASLDPIDSNVLKSIDQEQFNGFSYTNPHLIG